MPQWVVLSHVSATEIRLPESPVELPQIGRIPITNVCPDVDGGPWPARCTVGEVVPVRATIFRDGHDALAAAVVLTRPNGQEFSRTPMQLIDPGFSRFEAQICPNATGDWSFTIEAWGDPYATWIHAAKVKLEAGIDVELMLAEGERLLRAAQGLHEVRSPEWTALDLAAADQRDTTMPPAERFAIATAPDIQEVLTAKPLRHLVTKTQPTPLRVQRVLAGFSSWYEIFPRSIGAVQDEESGVWTSGNFQTAQELLPYVAGLGFSVIYMPPIHPIGTAHRKGPNNTLTASPTDPGSPYAIGSHEGGHDAIHPELGTIEDFRNFVSAAHDHGLEVALDLALQCSPDHPWVKQHPEWFTQRADGTIAYAENPPKKYQDIYPLNFDRDPEGIYQAILAVVLHWINNGVTLFRVDNPHTKPLNFWERLIAEVNRDHPDVIFLAEAFTKPAMMRTLGKIGFHQSYTYFTWRHTKAEFQDYLTQLSTSSDTTCDGLTGSVDYMRPNFWPTTPDILTPFMWKHGELGHRQRAILAATLSPSWGLYGGYEFVEDVPRPGAEEHINSEKYEFTPRDFLGGPDAGNVLAPLIQQLNEIRNSNPALRQLRSIRFHTTDNDNILAFSHHLPAEFSATGRANTVITVVSLAPDEHVTGWVTFDDAAWRTQDGHGASATEDIVDDQLTGETYTWGPRFYVALGGERQAHIAVVRH